MSKLRLDFPVPWPVRGFLKYVPAGQLAVRATSQAFVEVTLPVAAHFHTAIPLASMIERAALRYMRSQVIDPTVRDKLTPRYALGCKRPSFHNATANHRMNVVNALLSHTVTFVVNFNKSKAILLIAANQNLGKGFFRSDTVNDRIFN